jgi:hypothetical protein
MGKTYPTNLRRHQHHSCPPYTPTPQHHRYRNHSHSHSHNPRKRTTPLCSTPRTQPIILRRSKGMSRPRGGKRRTCNDNRRCPYPPRRPRNRQNRTWAYRVRRRLGTIMGCRAGIGEESQSKVVSFSWLRPPLIRLISAPLPSCCASRLL